MSKGREPDEWVMGQVAAGKREHLETLVRRYASPLLTFIQRMVGDAHRSEELFQEVFLAVWTKRKTYKFPRPFKSWLFAIAANRCRSDFRSAKPQPVSLEAAKGASPFAEDPSPVQSAVAVETAAQVANAVAQLPAQQRTVVVLRVWNGMSYAEIAEITGKTEGGVRANMHHALGKLKNKLQSCV